MTIPTNSTVQERVEIRNQTRNLENFLNYTFSENKKLGLIEGKVHGNAILVLKEIDQEQIDWKNYPSYWFYDNFNLRKITHYIAEKIPAWEQTVKDDAKKLVLLEKQCALFERLVCKYNEIAREKNPTEEAIVFLNPLRSKIEFITNYPILLGHKIKIDTSQEIDYDRLTSSEELAKKIEQAQEKPVLVQISGLTSVDNGKQEAIPFTVVPKNIFKKVVQESQALFDPMDGQLRDRHLVIRVSYDDPDMNAVNSALFKAGEQKAIPHAYEQGFVAGKIAGHAEAMQKIQAIFAGAKPSEKK